MRHSGGAAVCADSIPAAQTPLSREELESESAPAPLPAPPDNGVDAASCGGYGGRSACIMRAESRREGGVSALEICCGNLSAMSLDIYCQTPATAMMASLTPDGTGGDGAPPGLHPWGSGGKGRPVGRAGATQRKGAGDTDIYAIMRIITVSNNPRAEPGGIKIPDGGGTAVQFVPDKLPCSHFCPVFLAVVFDDILSHPYNNRVLRRVQDSHKAGKWRRGLPGISRKTH